MLQTHGKNEMTVKTATKTAAAPKVSKAASSKAPKGAPLTEAELLKMADKDYMNAALAIPELRLSAEITQINPCKSCP